jgi:D-beta-D-heptose 7-phosphate kinase/D-beta-D-heptose 1-phosphate adenosyltransferase
VLEIVRRCLPNVDTVLLVDCEKGFFNPTLLAQIIGLAGASGKRVLVDPSGWDFARYSGASVLLPSLVELGRAFGAEIGIDDAVLVDRAARCVLLSTGAEAVVLSCREKGVWVYQRGMKTIIPAVECAVVDVSGAGDSLVAAFTWILSRGDTILDAAVIGNLAGALAASKDGSVAITSAELKVYVEIPEPKISSKIVSRLDLVGKIAHAKAAGRRVVFTSGYFDLLHSAIDLLQGAKAMGDLLVIGLNSDDRRVGAGGPIVPELQRAKLLAALGCVDYVVPFTEETPLALIEAIRPDILVQGAN